MMSIQNGNEVGVDKGATIHSSNQLNWSMHGCTRTKIMSEIVWEAATVIGHIYERKELKI